MGKGKGGGGGKGKGKGAHAVAGAFVPNGSHPHLVASLMAAKDRNVISRVDACAADRQTTIPPEKATPSVWIGSHSKAGLGGFQLVCGFVRGGRIANPSFPSVPPEYKVCPGTTNNGREIDKPSAPAERMALFAGFDFTAMTIFLSNSKPRRLSSKDFRLLGL